MRRQTELHCPPASQTYKRQQGTREMEACETHVGAFHGLLPGEA